MQHETDIRLWLDHVPLSVNRVMRMHWAKRALYNKIFLNDVFYAKNVSKIFGRPEHTNVNVGIQINYAGQVAMDEDNLVASVKPILDSLVKVGLLKDDSPDHVRRLIVTQVKSRPQDTGAAICIQSAN